MNNKTPKQIVREYKLKFALIIVLYAVVLMLLTFIVATNLFFGLIGVIVLGLSVRVPFEKLREKEIESIIYEDLDPEKYGEVLALGVLKKSVRHKMIYLMATGKHDEILKLVNETEAKTMHAVDKCNNLYRQGYVYFERGEYDKLSALYRKYDKLKAENPKFINVLNNFTVFEKYDAFADDDFEYVVDVCDIDLNEINPKKQNHKLTRINVGFYRAVALYKMGKLDEAKKGFEDIIAFAPKMHKAKLSKEFISLIENQ